MNTVETVEYNDDDKKHVTDADIVAEAAQFAPKLAGVLGRLLHVPPENAAEAPPERIS
jgi:hypothetical protein